MVWPNKWNGVAVVLKTMAAAKARKKKNEENSDRAGRLDANTQARERGGKEGAEEHEEG